MKNRGQDSVEINRPALLGRIPEGEMEALTRWRDWLLRQLDSDLAASVPEIMYQLSRPCRFPNSLCPVDRANEPSAEQIRHSLGVGGLDRVGQR